MKLLFAIGILAACPPSPQKATSVSFAKSVLPILQKECIACHSGASAPGGFTLINRDALLRGGRHGATIIPGRSKEGTLIRYLTGELKPKMPPNGAMDLITIDLIRRWIDEGAKIDSWSAVKTVPLPVGSKATGKSVRSAPVTALSLSADGKRLVVAGYRAVRIMDTETGRWESTWPVGSNQIQAVALSPDGTRIAAAAGEPGVGGEVQILDVKTGKLLMKFAEHNETVQAVSWHPGGNLLATCSLDKTVRIWNADKGTVVKVLKDHADALVTVAFSSNGDLFASGGNDRTVKLYRTKDWTRIATLNAHQDAVTRIAFQPNGNLLATVSADKSMKVWALNTGSFENPVRTQYEGDVIACLAYSSDGKSLAWGANNRVVKVFSGDGANQTKELKQAQDWVTSVALGPDKLVAAGGMDGRIYLWDLAKSDTPRVIDPPGHESISSKPIEKISKP